MWKRPANHSLEQTWSAHGWQAKKQRCLARPVPSARTVARLSRRSAQLEAISRQDGGIPVQKILKDFENLTGHPYMRLVAGGAIFVLGIGISDIPTMIMSRGWPATGGKIITCRLVGTAVREWSGNYYIETNVFIKYQYLANGILYSSSAVNSISSPFSLYQASYASRYPVGKHVIVYYNPKNPSKAVLEPGFVNIFKAFDVFSDLLFGLGIYFIFLGITTKKKSDRSRVKM
jgi:hypothetical protein